MQGPAGGPRLFARPYHVSEQLDALLGVPIDVWSTKAFVGRWTDRQPGVDRGHTWSTDRNALEGTLVSRLPCPLKDVLLAYDRWAYQWDRLEPGQTLQIEPHNERDLQTVLKSFHAVKNKQNGTFVFQAQPFDQLSHDIPDIVRQMMFYQEAGAEGYTHLSNQLSALSSTPASISPCVRRSWLARWLTRTIGPANCNAPASRSALRKTIGPFIASCCRWRRGSSQYSVAGSQQRL